MPGGADEQRSREATGAASAEGIIVATIDALKWNCPTQSPSYAQCVKWQPLLMDLEFAVSLSLSLYISYAVSLFHLAVSFDVRVNEVYIAFFFSPNELLSLSLSLSSPALNLSSFLLSLVN